MNGRAAAGAVSLTRDVPDHSAHNVGEVNLREMVRTKVFLSFLSGAIWLGVLVSVLLGLAVQRVRADQTSLTPVADTFVASGQPSQSFGLDSGLWVGYGRPGGDLMRAILAGLRSHRDTAGQQDHLRDNSGCTWPGRPAAIRR